MRLVFFLLGISLFLVTGLMMYNILDQVSVYYSQPFCDELTCSLDHKVWPNQ